MTALKTDIRKLRALHSKGLTLVAIAKKLGVDKSTVSRRLKKLGLKIAHVTVERTLADINNKKVSTEYYEQENKTIGYLVFLAEKAKGELDWIEQEVPPQATKEYREWQTQKLAFGSEMRKLISAMSDVSYKLFHSDEIKETLAVILEEIGCESTECQKRIFERLRRRRAIRFPALLSQ